MTRKNTSTNIDVSTKYFVHDVKRVKDDSLQSIEKWSQHSLRFRICSDDDETMKIKLSFLTFFRSIFAKSVSDVQFNFSKCVRIFHSSRIKFSNHDIYIYITSRDLRSYSWDGLRHPIPRSFIHKLNLSELRKINIIYASSWLYIDQSDQSWIAKSHEDLFSLKWISHGIGKYFSRFIHLIYVILWFIVFFFQKLILRSP